MRKSSIIRRKVARKFKFKTKSFWQENARHFDLELWAWTFRYRMRKRARLRHYPNQPLQWQAGWTPKEQKSKRFKKFIKALVHEETIHGVW